MFKSTPANPYDDVVVKATDETLTGENWEIILNLCDKVQDEGEQGARNVIAAILKRLAHRNPNVQLYSLTLSESLSKNCTKDLHSEIASRAFTQALERLITDRTTHDKVRNRALMLIAMWTEDFESDPTLGIMEECYQSLKAKNYKFEPSDEPAPNDDDEARKREEEELQRVLELSMQDKGGRRNWNEYSLASSSSAGGSGSQVSTQASTARPPAAVPSSPSSSTPAPAYDQHAYSTGFVPSTETHAQATAPPAVESSPQSTSTAPTSPTSSTTDGYGVTRVRALHGFEPTEPNELAFEKGDVIKVVNREYKDWWRGQLRGRTGIFPVNYVEPLPEPTSAELAAEAQQEAAVFSQAVNVDRLLTMLRTLDPAKDNLADNDEIQELYRSCMSLRPKIVKLIDKYSQKRADLVSMNESFVKARTIFDRMMEESLARHSEYYEQQRPPFPQPQSAYPRPESRVPGQQAPGYGRPADQPQAYAWNTGVYDQTGYGVFPDATAAYTQPRPDPRTNLGRSASYAAGQFQSQPRPQVQPPSQQAQQAPQPQPQTAYSQPYPAQDNPRASYYPQAPPQRAEAPPQPEQTQTPSQPQIQQQPQVQLQSHPQSQHSPPQPQVQSQVPAPTQPQVQTQNVVQQQHPAQARASHSPVEPQPQAQAQKQQQQTAMTGPPFVFDPNATYPDQNMQAWAQYYAQGGTDPTGSVYFISVPGIKSAHSSPTTAAAVQPGAAEGQQQQQQQQATSTEPGASAVPGHIVTEGLQRQNSLPNPYGPGSATSGETSVGPVSAGPGGGPGMAAHAPWDATGAAATTRTSLPGQFAQMRVGEPSVGA